MSPGSSSERDRRRQSRGAIRLTDRSGFDIPYLPGRICPQARGQEK